MLLQHFPPHYLNLKDRLEKEENKVWYMQSMGGGQLWQSVILEIE